MSNMERSERAVFLDALAVFVRKQVQTQGRNIHNTRSPNEEELFRYNYGRVFRLQSHETQQCRIIMKKCAAQAYRLARIVVDSLKTCGALEDAERRYNSIRNTLSTVMSALCLENVASKCFDSGDKVAENVWDIHQFIRTVRSHAAMRQKEPMTVSAKEMDNIRGD